jgi:hypothetical protein
MAFLSAKAQRPQGKKVKKDEDRRIVEQEIIPRRAGFDVFLLIGDIQK